MPEISISKVRRFPAKFFRQTGRRLKRFYKIWIVRDTFTIEVRRWFKDNGDEALRLTYDLDENSIVFDLGGYVGDFAAAISDKYGCYVYLFEPSAEFFEQCQARFASNDKVKCFNFGLGGADGQFILSADGDASSTKSEQRSAGGSLVSIRKFCDVFDELKLSRIDLLKINIEGGEYEVLPHLIDTGLIGKIRFVQVQFHTFVENANSLRAEIVESLKNSHERDWCYTFVWESWHLK